MLRLPLLLQLPVRDRVADHRYLCKRITTLWDPLPTIGLLIKKTLISDCLGQSFRKVTYLSQHRLSHEKRCPMVVNCARDSTLI